MAVALDGGQKVEAGGAGVTRLDAVHALHAVEQMIVVRADPCPRNRKPGSKNNDNNAETILNGAPENGQVMQLSLICPSFGQARCIFIMHAGKDECMCLIIIISAKACSFAADELHNGYGNLVSEHMTMALITSSTLMVSARFRAELGRRLYPRMAGIGISCRAEAGPFPIARRSR